MPGVEATDLLRADLLDGVGVVLAGAGEGAQAHRPAAAPAVDAACSALGARVGALALGAADASALDEPELEAALDRLVEHSGRIDLLVVDGWGLYAPTAGTLALRACMEASWNAARGVANRAFIPGGEGGRIVFVSPPAGAGEHAGAVRAGLENLARTLSIEWARHSITAVAVAPGAATVPEEVGALVAYLASPAGAYFSGCLLDMSAAAP
jgi:NAD(P)-dependent dehydrogenase (short-subunit alcohol dehydrogenase family)